MLSRVSETVGKASLSWIGGSFPRVHLTRVTAAAPRFPRPCRNSLKQCWRFRLAGQFLVSQSPSDDLRKRQGEASAVIVLAFVVAERLFVQIAEQMERLNTYVGSFQSALQQRPEILNSVRVDIAVYVAFGVIDYLMNVIGIQPVVRTPRIAENVRAAFNEFAHDALKRRAARIGDVAQADLLGLAIQQAHDHGLAATSSASASDLFLFVLVHESSSAADKRLVNLKISSGFYKCAVLHCLADAMEHEPRGFLSDAQIAGDLARANAVLAICDQPNRREPFIQPDRRVLEDRSDFGAELLLRMLGLALPNLTRRQQGNFRAPASRARDWTVRPAHRNRRAHAVIGIREVGDRFMKRVWDVSVHAQRVAQDGR